MGLYSSYKTDENLETAGIALVVGETDAGKKVCIKIARAGGANKAFQRVLAAKTRPYRRQIDQNTMSNSVMEGLMAEVYADTVVLDWENVTDENDNPLDCTRENIIKVFTDLPDLFSDVRAGAADSSAFRAEILDAVVKN